MYVIGRVIEEIYIILYLGITTKNAHLWCHCDGDQDQVFNFVKHMFLGAKSHLSSRMGKIT